MDDAMYDIKTGSQDDGAGHEPVKRKPVRPAELRLDDSKENLGLERVAEPRVMLLPVVVEDDLLVHLFDAHRFPPKKSRV